MIEIKVPTVGDTKYPTTEEWRAAGLRAFTLGLGGRMYWEQKSLMAWSYCFFCAIGFGFIGYCMGTVHGEKGEAILALAFSVFGGTIGYGAGLAFVFIGRRVAAWRIKQVQKKHL